MATVDGDWSIRRMKTSAGEKLRPQRRLPPQLPPRDDGDSKRDGGDDGGDPGGDRRMGDGAAC